MTTEKELIVRDKNYISTVTLEQIKNILDNLTFQTFNDFLDNDYNKKIKEGKILNACLQRWRELTTNF